MTTINEAVSRVRNTIKAVKEDPFMTDRYIYGVILKYAQLLIRRQDNEMKVYKINSLFKTLPCVDLIEVDKVEACCGDIKSGCIIKRTKDKIPQPLQGAFGPIIRTVSSIDGSNIMSRTYPTIYTRLTKTSGHKYNKTKYYWFLDGYLYMPNIEWDAVSITALFEGSTAYLTCGDKEDDCTLAQNRQMAVPDYLFAEIEQYVLKELLTLGQIPPDAADDSQNVLR
jgi:hypothetical protein